VLRYFDSLEAIFLEILDRARRGWIVWPPTCRRPRRRPGRMGARSRWRRRSRGSLVEAPLLRDLIAAMAGVLERNITVEFARSFNLTEGLINQLAGIVAAQPDRYFWTSRRRESALS
jgi:hypothetical protein